MLKMIYNIQYQGQIRAYALILWEGMVGEEGLWKHTINTRVMTDNYQKRDD